MRKIIGILFLLILGINCQSAFAQLYPTQYRPPQQNWHALTTDHFKIIYNQENDSSALVTAQLLEDQYTSIQQLVGGELSNFPVVLNNYNDRSNGFVNPFNFRSEIELPPIKSKSMNPRTGGWLQNVAPHELVHAMQFSNLGDYNIPQLVSLFSPDLARSFHGAIPAGIVEGIAVHHESEGITDNGGRGNYPFFTNRFNAIFKSNQRWSMGQHIHYSSNTRPFDRHYIGGYEFTSWLHNKYGPATNKEALDFYMDWPFLGYGVALRHATGQWPGQLYNKFEKTHSQELKGATASDQQVIHPHLPYKGRKIRRPKWLSSSKLIFYGSFYNKRPGFYSYNLQTDQLNQLLVTNTVNDYNYSLSADRSRMVYSYYEADPIYDRTSKAELVQYHFASNKKEQLTQQARYYAPVFFKDDLLALQTAPASSRLVSLNSPVISNSKTKIIAENKEYEIKAVATNPKNSSLAIVANKNGLQALWITSRESLENTLEEAPDIALDGGSIFDPQWHPDGNKLLFSSDASGSFQLYEYNLSSKTTIQITKNGYNAFEGSYSPDGNRIAFIQQVKNEQLPVVLSRSNFFDKAVNKTKGQYNALNKSRLNSSTISDSIKTKSSEWPRTSYSPGISWLKPRTFLPVFEEVSNQDVYQWGLEFHSTNTLSNQSYSAEVTLLEKRTWYDLSYQNKTFYPGFKASLYNRPDYRFFSLSGSLQNLPFLRQERGGSVSIPISVTLNNNIFSTGFYIEPEVRYSQIRFIDLSGHELTTEFGNTTIGNIYGQFNFRLQQNARDIQPNSGALIYGELEHYLGSKDISKGIDIDFIEPTGFQGGLFTYFSPLRRWNQSLRLGIKGITQTAPIYNNQNIVSNAFSDPVFLASNNIVSFNSRYTIPLFFVDDGGFLLPLYLNNLYLVGFTDTVLDPTANNWYEQSRTVFGLGLRARFRISNMAIDLGVGLGYEASRNKTHIFIGDF
ncbi:PD40 domain-containing protein [Fodinibius halophilus]|uniref:BamA/TamA family outer membrane protein n=1 Tax=Fodinibius halophilus TaxID=1736908 RepID=A0A6M1T7M3_9BACT|nr:PD40 domain-containing protein [Fodinibius halophilus]NGP87124.1 hypothetical protein [Fodinibius halophilus]